MTPARLNDPLDRAHSDVVLIVDDVPDNLSVLHDALDETSYTVLVATCSVRRTADSPPVATPRA